MRSFSKRRGLVGILGSLYESLPVLESLGKFARLQLYRGISIDHLRKGE